MEILEKNEVKIKTFFDSDLEMFEELDKAEIEMKNIKSKDLMTLEDSYSEINTYMNNNLKSKKVSYV